MNKKPKFLFDYIYYRSVKLYFKLEGRNGITSTILITVTQTLILLDLLLCVLTILFSREAARNNIDLIEFSFVIGFLIFLFFNFKRYKNKYFEFKRYWSEETSMIKFYKGVLSLIVIIIPWIVLILFAAYT